MLLYISPRSFLPCVVVSIGGLAIFLAGCGENGGHGGLPTGSREVTKPVPRSIVISSGIDGKFGMGLMTRDVTLQNNCSGIDELSDVHLIVTLYKTTTSEVTQKSKDLARWRQGEIITIEGFDAGNSMFNVNGLWDCWTIKGDAKNGTDLVKFDIDTRPSHMSKS